MPDVFMPRLSDTMTEGAISQWLKSEGEEVHPGDVLAEIETDKAVMELEAYEGGVLEKILIPAGQTVPIGAPIAILGDGSGAVAGGGASGDAGPAVEPVAEPAAESAVAQAPAPAAKSAAAQTPAPAPAASPSEGRPFKASPVVRSLARTHGIDLSTITGTGPGGRIIRADVERLLSERAATPAPATAPVPLAAAPAVPTVPTAPIAPAPGQPAISAPAAVPLPPVGQAGPDDDRIPLSTIRKVTARRLSEAALVPVFQLTTVLDATRLTELRGEINTRLTGSGVRISVTDLLVRAAAVALRAHPALNSSFGGDAIIRHAHVNVGVAVALDEGLIVPVIRDADRKSVSEIGAEAKDLASRARAGRLTPDEFSGGTFTISNLGMYGIDSFIAVLNPPEAAILAVGSTVDEPVVIDGEVRVRARTRLTLTVDHRVADGATAAAFLRELTDLLTEPLRILV